MSPYEWLLLVFLTLKLCKFIDWSWWWVTSPIWGMLLDAIKDVLRALRKN